MPLHTNIKQQQLQPLGKKGIRAQPQTLTLGTCMHSNNQIKIESELLNYLFLFLITEQSLVIRNVKLDESKTVQLGERGV